VKSGAIPTLRLIEGGRDRPPPPASSLEFARTLARRDVERMIAAMSTDSQARK